MIDDDITIRRRNRKYMSAESNMEVREEYVPQKIWTICLICLTTG